MWFVAAALWVGGAAIEFARVPEGAGFVLFEAVWIAAHLAVLVGLVALGRMRPHGDSRVGEIGLKAAIGARIVFLLGEADCIRTGTNESVLLPIGALVTAVGMIFFGAAVARRRGWLGWRRFAPLTMGVYPFLGMFPVVAATGEPSSVAIGAWAVTFVVIGMAAIREGRSTGARSARISPAPAV